MTNRIVVVEGRQGSGKTTLVNHLADHHGFIYYSHLFLPPHLDNPGHLIHWSTPTDAYVEFMVTANMRVLERSIVLDRGMLSWCYYNDDDDDKINKLGKWFALLRLWDFAKIVCLTTNDDLIRKRRRDPENDMDFEDLYKFVPEDLIIKCDVTENGWFHDSVLIGAILRK